MAKKKALELRVNFGGVSIGDGTARLGVTIDRALMTLPDADTKLCGRRLTGMAVQLGPQDDLKQGTVVDDLRHEINGVFDVKKLSIGPDDITFGMTFGLKDVDVSELACFAKKSGLLSIDEIGEIPDRASKADDEDEGDDE